MPEKINVYRCLISTTLGKSGKTILLSGGAAAPYIKKGLIALAEETASVEPVETKEIVPVTTKSTRGRRKK